MAIYSNEQKENDWRGMLRPQSIIPAHARRLKIGSEDWWYACDLAFKSAMREYAHALLREKRMREREERQSCQTSQ